MSRHLALFFIILSIFFKVAADLCAKQAGLSTIGEGYFFVLFNYWYLAALTLAVMQAVSWGIALRNSSLSFAYPFTSLSLVLGVMGAVYFFGEAIKLTELTGLCIILFGLLIITTDKPEYSS